MLLNVSFGLARSERLFISTSNLLSIPTLYCNALSPWIPLFRCERFPSSSNSDIPRFEKRGWHRRKDRKDERRRITAGWKRTGFNEKKRRGDTYAKEKGGGRGMSGWRGKKQRERERTRVGEDVATAQMQNVHADIKHTYMQDAAAASILRSLSSPGALPASTMPGGRSTVSLDSLQRRSRGLRIPRFDSVLLLTILLRVLGTLISRKRETFAGTRRYVTFAASRRHANILRVDVPLQNRVNA